MTLVGLLCFGSMIIVALYVISAAPIPPGQENPKEMLGAMDAAAPSFKYYGLAMAVMTLVESVVLIVSGWGLLKMRSWGRALAIFYAAICILGTVGGLVYTFAVLNPALQAAAEAEAAQNPEKEPAVVFASGSGNPVVDAVFNVIFSLFFMALAVANLIVMLLPSVKRAFAVANGRAPPQGAIGSA
jgi:hypothetical protein